MALRRLSLATNLRSRRPNQRTIQRCVAVNQLNEGEQGVVVLNNTPFYAESGGQIGDCGELKGSSGIFAVEDTQKIQANVFGHHGVLKTGALNVGDHITARVNTQARASIMRNHSATHLMHKALREVLGEHVQQKGSLVDSDKTALTLYIMHR